MLRRCGALQLQLTPRVEADVHALASNLSAELEPPKLAGKIAGGVADGGRKADALRYE